MASTPLKQVFNPLSGFNLVPKDPAQVVTVAKSGAMFTTIQAAIDSITDATALKPYVVAIAAGVYAEDVVIKNNIELLGEAHTSTIISGTLSGTLTTSCSIYGLSVNFVATADGQSAITLSGGVVNMYDVWVTTTGTGDFSHTCVKLTSGFIYYVQSCAVACRMTYAGITKDFAGWEFAGTGAFDLTSAAVSDRVNALSGTRCMYKVTGTGSFKKDNGNATFVNTNALFSGQVRGFCVSSAAAAGNTRSTNGAQCRLTGAGAGTAIGFRLDSGGNSAEFQHIGSSIFISGFTPATQYLDSTATGDTQKLWIASTDRDLVADPTAGGLAITTPRDEVRTGFVAWSTVAGNIWSFTPATGTFSTLKRFTAVVKSSPVVAPVATLTGATALPDLAVSYVYADSTGALASTVTSTDALYESNVPIFQVWKDNTNSLVCRENHPLKFGPAVSIAWHSQFGALLHSASSTLGIGLAGAKCGFTGENTIGDHGLTSTVAEAVAGFTATFVYVDGAGKMRFYSSTDTFPAFYNNAGTPTIATVGSNRWVIFRIGVIKDSGLTGSDTAQFVVVMDTVQNTSTGNATSRISSGLVTPFPPELKALEVCQVGFVIVRKTSAGVVDTTNVPPVTALQVFGAQYVSGGTSTSASLITTNTTNFNGQLSGAETSAQLCFDRLDKYGFIGVYATGVEYRVGNPVVQNGCVYRCTTALAAITNTAWTAAKASFTQVSIARYADVAAAQAANANDTDLCYVTATETFYRYVAAGGAFTADGLYVLTTGDAGNTRRIAVAGRYVQGAVTSATSIQGSTGLSNAAPGTVSTSTGGQQGSSTLVARMDHNHSLGVHTHDTNGVGGPIKSNRIIITQANSYTAGQAVYHTGTNYQLAKANAAATSEVVGIVESSDGSTFTMITDGYIAGLSGLTAGTAHFLSDATPGLITATEPTTIGNISKPVLIAVSATAGFVVNMRGSVVGGANARTIIALANNTTATIQDVSTMLAGELVGWVTVDATADYRFYVQAQWCKNAAGTNWNLAYQVTGDTPPVGFSLSITSAGLVQYTMPNEAGFVSASINYALNAPAVSATFPLSISAANVLGATDGAAVGSGKIGESLATVDGFTVYAVNTAKTMTSRTLQPGTYILIGQSIFGNNSITGPVNSILAISENNDSLTGTVQGTSRLDGLSYQSMSLTHYVTISVATTYYLVVQTNATSGNAQNIWSLRYIRIA